MHSLRAVDVEKQEGVHINMNSDFSGEMYLTVHQCDPDVMGCTYTFRMSADYFKSLVLQGLRYLSDEDIIKAIRGNL